MGEEQNGDSWALGEEETERLGTGLAGGGGGGKNEVFFCIMGGGCM
jgi:hypothetical protein